MGDFSKALGASMGGPLIGALLPSNTRTSSSQTSVGHTSTKKNISQEGINKLIYDALSADSGLASLATGENLSGGYGASTKALLAQDFMVKLIGELANVTAETTSDSTAQQDSKSSSSKRITVICTELYDQGLLEPELYNHPRVMSQQQAIHPYTLAGYHFWAVPLVARMKKSSLLSHLLLPIVRSRYRYIIAGRFHPMGILTICVGQPICFVLGALVNMGVGYAVVG